MFSRSHSRSHGFGKEKDKSREAVQLSALAELGLIGDDKSKSRSSGGGARRTDFHRPSFSSSSAARFTGGATYPEKCKWTAFHSGPRCPIPPLAPLRPCSTCVLPSAHSLAANRYLVEIVLLFSSSRIGAPVNDWLTPCLPSRPLDRFWYPSPSLAPLVALHQLHRVAGE